MIEDTQSASSFDAFNFGSDRSGEPEMALAQDVWQEFDEAAGNGQEEEQPFETEDTVATPPASEAEPGILPTVIFELGLVSTTVFPLFANIFRRIPNTKPLEIHSNPNFQFTQARSVHGTAPKASGCIPQVDRWIDRFGALNKQFDHGSSNWIDRIARVISRHEGRADSINWNDNGAGISIGLFQANQKHGELPTLLHRMEKTSPQIFAHLLGDSLAEIAKWQPEKVRQIQFTNASGNFPNNLGLQLHKALEQSSFQQVQLDMLAEKIVHAAKVANAYGIRSERGIALVADLINQLGEGKGNGLSGAKRYLHFALAQKSEFEKINQIIKHDLKGFGRAARDKDILLDPHLDNCSSAKPENTTNLVLLNPAQPSQTKAVAIHTKTHHHTGGYV